MRRALMLVCLGLCACAEAPPAVLGGDPENGRLLLRQYGCGNCHRILGVATAEGRAAPPLADIGRRVYLGGVLPNTPQNMVRFIRSPQDADPRTLMPDLGVGDAHARDMVAYLSTLK